MRIKKFLQTPFISHSNENMVKLSVDDWDHCNPYLVEVSIDNVPVYSNKIFAAQFTFTIPCPTKICKCCVTLTPFEDTPIQKTYFLAKPKEWKIPLLYSSHEDIGYCGYAENLPYECYEYLKKAMQLCFMYPGFKYMIEHYWWLSGFDTYATAAEKAELRALIKDKRIELNAPHSGMHTNHASPEQLVRGMYFSCRNAKEKYDIAPECAIFADISGITWSAVDAYAKMGIKYCGVLPNNWRNSEHDITFPPLFRWKSKTGDESVLFWHQRSYRPYGLWNIWCDTKRQYSEGEFVFDHTKTIKTEDWLTDRINALGDVEYDILPLSFYDDRETPTTMLLTVCEEMNKKWKYPQLRMEIPSIFFKEIEEQYGDTLPIFSGEVIDQWSDFATIAPEWTAKKRETARLFYDAEMLSALDGDHKTDIFSKSIWNMCLFDEHCWATSAKHPQHMHKANLKLTKHDSVYSVADELSAIIAQKCGFPTSKMSVTSTILQKRRDRIRQNQAMYVPQNHKHQILPDGTVITELLSFSGAETKGFDGVLPFNNSKEITTEAFETPYYKVSLDTQTKTVTSIICKETNREILDTDSSFELGQFIYLNSDPNDTSKTAFEVSRKLCLRVYDGDIAYVIVQNGFEEQSGAEICCQLIFYKDDKTIDIDLSYKNTYGLMGDFYDRYRKNFFFALPLSLENPEFYTESQCCEINERTDKININANDFATTVNWLAAENSDYGFAIHSADAPIFHIGNIKYNRFDKEFNATSSHYYLYASSNRCNNLIYDSSEKCKASYRLSLLPYKGTHHQVVPLWSNRLEHRLIAGGEKEERKYLSITSDNVRLVALKEAEDCSNAIVLRFTETAGKASTAIVTLPFEPKSVMYCTPDERDTFSVAYTGNKLEFEYEAYTYTTLKVYKK